jgi:prephenate dehydrogenase
MASPSDPPFQSIAVVGLGLIGGSVALAVRERWPATRVIGVDRQAVLAHALGSGAIDRVSDSMSALTGAELIVLAAPVQQNLQLLQDVDRLGLPASVTITDVGGTKRSIVDAARQLRSAVAFIGGHPLGGGERGGFAFARPDLFVGRPWILTPDATSGSQAVDRLSQFAAGLGARPRIMTAAEHDRVMAFVSHLPQLAASGLMAAVGEGVGADGLRMAGKGLLDTTRLASSPADLWRDICATNADGIGDALDRLIQVLTLLRADLDRGDTLEQTFGEAARWRAELTRLE